MRLKLVLTGCTLSAEGSIQSLTFNSHYGISQHMKCKLCKAEVANIGELTKHRTKAHPELEQKRIQDMLNKAHPPKPEGGGNGSHPAGTTQSASAPADSIATASLVRVIPRPFSMSPVYLWRAKETCINEWGWPKDMSDEDFVDTFFYIMCYKCGKDLDKAGNVNQEEGGNGSKQTNDGANA